jgi:hypothetical protein
VVNGHGSTLSAVIPGRTSLARARNPFIH